MNAVVKPILTPPTDLRKAPARALLGWLTEQEALGLLCGQCLGAVGTANDRARYKSAHEMVVKRESIVETAAPVNAMPSSLSHYIDALNHDPGMAPLFAEGWRVKLVDLRRVRAFQPYVITGMADAFTAGLADGNYPSLAEVTIPKTTPRQLNIQTMPSGNSYSVTSRSQNLRLLGMQQGQSPDGSPVLTFTFGEAISRVSVMQVGNKCVLTDGYHRALGMLRKKIHMAPVLVRVLKDGESIATPLGMLPAAVYLGNHPPLLPDYLDDGVAGDVFVNETYKMIVIHAHEITPTLYS